MKVQDFGYGLLKSKFLYRFQEILRIRSEHPEDDQSILKDRVKGQLKVTRAFGAGFLKKVQTKLQTNFHKS